MGFFGVNTMQSRIQKVWEYLRSKPKKKVRPLARLLVELLEQRCVPTSGPSGTSNTVTTIENVPYVFHTADFGFTDSIPGQTFSGVQITTLPSAGSLSDNGVAITSPRTVVSAADISNNELVFTPATNSSGSPYTTFTFAVEATSNNTAVPIPDPSPKTMTIDVTFVNQPPSGTNNTVSAAENGAYTFHTADFGFTDPNNPAEAFQAVEITTLPTHGMLTDNGVQITANGTFVTATDIANGDLVFTPAANALGSPYDNFTFQVQNNGGTANGGIDTDQTPNTMTIDVVVPNQAPSGANKTITVAENSSYVLQTSDFGFTDPNTPPSAFQAVKITTAPTHGALTDNGVAVAAGTFVSVTDIANGELVFTPGLDSSGSPYATFTFQVQNSGGTQAGGADTDPTPKTMTFNVPYINQPPTGTSKTVTTVRNTAYTFLTSDFGFNDPNSPVNSLQAVEITTLPTNGTLADNGTQITAAGAFVSAADIANGELVYTPGSSATGRPYDGFTFQVQNNGGTANGGADTDPSPKTMTIDVVVPTLAPSGKSKTVTTAQNAPYVFQTSDFGFTDPNAPAYALKDVEVTTLPTSGTLSDNGVALTAAGTFVSATDIANGNFVFTPAASATGTPYGSFTFQVQNTGGTAGGGVDTDPTPKTMTINVPAAIVAASGTVSGTAFIDANGNGKFDSGEVALPGVVVTLTGTTTFQSKQVNISAVTDANGHFSFLNLMPGTYSLKSGTAAALIHGNAASIGNISASPGVTIVGGQTLSNNVGYRPGLKPAYVSVAQFLTESSQSDYSLATPGSGKALANTRADKAPTLSNQIGAQAVLPGTTGTFDLAGFFTDPDITNSKVTFNITENGVSKKIHVNLNDTTTPQAVANFFDYVNAGYYNNLFFTRETNTAADGIGVLQAGGATIVNGTGPTLVTSLATVPDEFGNGVNSNGTLAAANTGSANSASAQFFFNTANNTTLNSHYTVFGATADPTSLAILNSLSSTPTQDLSSSSASISTATVSTDGTNTVTIVTTATEKFKVGQTVTISGLGNRTGGYNGIFTIVSAPTSTSFTYVDAAAAGLAEDTSGNGTATAGPLFAQNSPSLLLNEVPLNTSGSVTNFPTTASSYVVINSVTIDKRDEFLTYSNPIVSNESTNNVVTASITNEHLNLGYDNAGTATVSVTATDRYGASVTMSFNVTVAPPNQAPAGTSNTVSTAENTPYVFKTSDFGFSDPNIPPYSLKAVEITTLPAAGTLADTNLGHTIAAGTFIPVADITGGDLVFTPASNASGSPYTTFTFQVQNSGGTANGGVDTDPSAKTMTIDVIVPNQAPSGTSTTVATAENTPYVFHTSDFGYSDPNNPPNSFQAVEITTTPTNGTLTDNATGSLVTITAGTFVPVADITGGNLVFTPATGATGVPYASFTFQVQNNGGTLAGGIDTDPNPKTMTIDVVIPNQPPSGADNTITVPENTSYVFQESDFGFSDPNTPPNSFLAVEITTAPTAGTLTDNGVIVNAGTFVPVTDINAGNLVFTPAANSSGNPYAIFTFQVQNDGGTLAGGVDTDPTPNTMSFNVPFVNLAPSGADNTVGTTSATPYVFKTADFGFSDPNHPAQSLQAVEITTVPTNGTLTDNGTPVTVNGTFVSASDIANGELIYTPSSAALGNPYDSFTFQVQNSGGTANGGVDTDPTARTMTIDVVVPTLAPSGADNTVTTNENNSYVFQTADFGFSDPNNPPFSFQAVEITTLPTLGTLIDDVSGTQVPVAAGAFVPVADIMNGHFAFKPATDTSGTGYASFTFQVQNNGGTLAGGVDTDPTPNTMTINVTYVNQAPSGANSTVTTAVNIPYVFSASDFHFSDPNIPANSLQAVEITTTPTHGTLTDNSSGSAVPVAAGTFVSAADITGGHLIFTPASSGSGSPYDSFTFQVQNNGGTANGGIDIDPTPRTMAINVIVPNQPPSGTDKTVSTTTNTPYVFLVQDFGFSDPNNPPFSFQAVEITTLPTLGTLTDNGAQISAGAFVSVADITSGGLIFTPVASATGHPYTSFTFQVQNNGGTAFGGINTDPTPNTMTINVNLPNTTP
jgi:cyclophilin family peptidyl-prolyl cis-trans isomerase